MADTENNDTCGINRQAYPIPPISFPGADTSARFVFFDFIDHSLLSNSEMLEQWRKSIEQETLRCFTHCAKKHQWIIAPILFPKAWERP